MEEMTYLESFIAHFAETESQQFLRLGPSNWYVRMGGESWEPCYEEEEGLERAFSEMAEKTRWVISEDVLTILENMI